MTALAPIFKKAYWTLAGVGAAYAAFLLCLLNPTVQKHAIYVHKIHSGYFNDITKPENYGFAKNQVTPFNISTADGERLFAWHVLPIGLYAKHEEELLAESTWLPDDITQRKGFQLLADDPDSKLIILFHGNAGHVAEGWRPGSLRSLSSGSSTNIHTLIVDYRGFGHSTGDPSEAGLIADGIATVNWAMNVAKIPPSRIVLLGQSLGTAVTTAVALHFASGPETPVSNTLPASSPLPADLTVRPPSPVDFAGIVLVAPFTNLPHLVLSYKIKGILPILSPLRPYPYLQNTLSRYIVDSWDSAARLAELVRITTSSSNSEMKRHLRIQILHARDDVEINWKQGEALFQAAIETEADAKAEGKAYQPKILKKGEGFVEIHRKGEMGEIRLDIVGHGGHNEIVSHAPVSLAVLRAFGMS